jgi:hypothetical protein
MGKHFGLVGLGLLALSGCTSSLPYFEPVVTPLAVTIDPAEATTENTDNIVFRQTVDFPATAVLLEGFSSPPTGTYRLEHDVPAGTVLHPGFLDSSEYSGPGYCTMTPTMKMKVLIGGGDLYGYTCFADTDRSGTFDLYFSKGRLLLKTSGGRIRYKNHDMPGGAPLKAGYVDAPIRLDKALPYRAEQGTPTDERFEFIVKFMPNHGFGVHRLEMIKLDNGKETELLSGSKDIPAAEYLPVTMNFMGVKVEVLAVENGVLRYRIKSGLDPKRIISTDLSD